MRRMRPLAVRTLLAAFAALALVGCGADTPVPDYPFPQQRPLEERADLAEYVGGDDYLEEEVEEEEWDDGLSDEDLMMDGDSSQGETGGDAETTEAAEGETEAPEDGE